MYCKKCGQIIKQGDKFCNYCGTEVYVAANSVYVQNENPSEINKPLKKTKIVTTVIIALVIIGLITGAIIFFNVFVKDDDKRADETTIETAYVDDEEDDYSEDTETEITIQKPEETTEEIEKTTKEPEETEEKTTMPDKGSMGGEYLNLDADLQYDVNIFLSNFSEATMENFSVRAEDKDMLDYAITYNFINKQYEFESCNVELDNGIYGNFRIHKDKVLQTVKKYFGYQLNSSVCNDVPYYYDGYFYLNFTGANLCNGFCIVSSLEKLENNQYRAVFDIYLDGEDGSDYYGCSKEEIEGYDKKDELYLYKIRTGYAIIHADDIYDRSTYTLSAYYDEDVQL